MERRGGGGKGGGNDVRPSGKEVEKPTLKAAGIDHKRSSRAQKLAAVPGDKFEGMSANETPHSVRP